MSLILQIVFIALVIADCILTYRVLANKKGVEKKYQQITWPIKLKLPTLMGICIDYPIFEVAVTTLGVLAILYLVNESGFYLWLTSLNIAFGYACWKSWRILHG